MTWLLSSSSGKKSDSRRKRTCEKPQMRQAAMLLTTTTTTTTTTATRGRSRAMAMAAEAAPEEATTSMSMEMTVVASTHWGIADQPGREIRGTGQHVIPMALRSRRSSTEHHLRGNMDLRLQDNMDLLGEDITLATR